MTNKVDKRPPQQSNLLNFVVGQEVSSAKTLAWANQLDFLLGYNKNNVMSCFIPTLTTASALTSMDLYFQYQKSPGTQVLCIEHEMQTDPLQDNYGLAYAELSSSQPFQFIGTSSIDPNRNFIYRLTPYQQASTINAEIIRNYIDVSNVSSSSVGLYKLTVTNYTNSSSNELAQGIRRLSVTEIPLENINPLSQSVDEGWCNPRQRLYAGSTTSSFGFTRIANQLDQARTGFRNHWQISTHTDHKRVWAGDTGSDNPLNYQLRTSGSQRLYYHKVRKLYSNSTTVPYRFSTVYKTSSGAGLYRLTLWHKPSGSGFPPTAVDLSCPASTTWTTASMEVNLPTTGIDTTVQFYFTTWVGSINTRLSCSNISLIEQQI